jgi:hypothetical protein
VIVSADLSETTPDATVGAVMAVSTEAKTEGPPEICERLVTRLEPQGSKAKCALSDGGSLLLPIYVARFVRPGDIFCFPADLLREDESLEVYIQRPTARRDFLFAQIEYVRHERGHGQNGPTARADLRNRTLGISSICLRCETLRDYFYVGDRQRSWNEQPSFYDLLRTESKATTAELRIAFRLRTLELRAARSSTAKIQCLERGFNVLADSSLRESYDQVLLDAAFAVAFPYHGFGSLLVEGSRSRDGATFFASRILSFRPRQSLKTIRAPLRHFTFYKDMALFRDVRRKLEIPLDPGLLPLSWDPSWNRWKHLLGVQATVKAVFVQTGEYRHREGGWEFKIWETALPSRTEVELPDNVLDQIAKARSNYMRFGKYADALDKVRHELESMPIERDDLRRICSRLGIPADFDVSLVTWKPDYEEFYHQELCRRARHLYLFRAEYIFDLETLIVVETPQLGHATYLFSKSSTMHDFLKLYSSTTREEILQNRNNVAESLGFLSRIIHGRNPQTWLAALKAHVGSRDKSETS